MNKRRASFAIGPVALFPVPDGTVDADDRRQIAGLYPGLSSVQIINDIVCPVAFVSTILSPSVSVDKEDC